jgi:alginate O-acetyltransferase complex protein AlgI
MERLGLSKLLLQVGEEYRHLYAILVIIIGWVFFRANDLDQALYHLAAMAGLGSGDGIVHHVWIYLQPDVALALLIGAVGSTPYFSKFGARVLEHAAEKYRRSEIFPISGGWVIVLALYAMFVLSTAMIAGGNYNPFIYFRF